ncbi:hypothetical protein VB780_08300 [Leptolyngbya sp. CCNP1308]|nr:hypothetical protein [Leptolyngbya sp. CCNP1308]
MKIKTSGFSTILRFMAEDNKGDRSIEHTLTALLRSYLVLMPASKYLINASPSCLSSDGTSGEFAKKLLVKSRKANPIAISGSIEIS